MEDPYDNQEREDKLREQTYRDICEHFKDDLDAVQRTGYIRYRVYDPENSKIVGAFKAPLSPSYARFFIVGTDYNHDPKALIGIRKIDPRIIDLNITYTESQNLAQRAYHIQVRFGDHRHWEELPPQVVRWRRILRRFFPPKS